MRLPSWTPLLLVALAVAAWPVVGMATAAPKPMWAHADGGDPVPKGDPVTAAAPDVAGELAAAGVTSVGLEPAPWKGTERSTDFTPSTSSGSKIKLVYAFAADQPDRFAMYADLIQSDAKGIAETVAAAADGTKSLRFDTGTDGGAGYVDVASVRLPQAAATYRAMDAGSRSNAIRVAIGGLGQASAGHYAVFADNLYGGDGVAGIAQMYENDTKAASNWNNAYPLWAVVFGTGIPTFANGHRTTLLHEISHTLGAVQDSSPNSTTYGHCADQQDVMCYDDGGLKPGQAMSQRCADVQYDCNGDDYFNPAPASGSYLATRWNVYDSSFLCAPAECVAGGPTNVAPETGDGGAPVATAPPAAPAPPAVTTVTPPVRRISATGHAARRSTRTAADRAVAATLAAGRRALRRGVPAHLVLRFSAPSSGRLRVGLLAGSRQVAHVSRRVSRGHVRITLTLSRRARRSARNASSAVLQVTFAPSTGTVARARIAVARSRH